MPPQNKRFDEFVSSDCKNPAQGKKTPPPLQPPPPNPNDKAKITPKGTTRTPKCKGTFLPPALKSLMLSKLPWEVCEHVIELQIQIQVGHAVAMWCCHGRGWIWEVSACLEAGASISKRTWSYLCPCQQQRH